MRYIDLLESEDKDSLINEIKNSNWFKQAKNDLYRGSKRVLVGDILRISKLRKRNPRDIGTKWHDYMNKMSYEKHGIFIRNGLFMITSLYNAEEYGNAHLVFPLDNAELYYNPDVEDLFVDKLQLIQSGGTDKSEDEIYDELDKYVDGIKEYNLDTISSCEVIGFGDFVLMDITTAKRNGLIKNQDVTTTNEVINKSIEIARSDKTNSISNKVGSIIDTLSTYKIWEKPDTKLIVSLLEILDKQGTLHNSYDTWEEIYKVFYKLYNMKQSITQYRDKFFNISLFDCLFKFDHSELNIGSYDVHLILNTVSTYITKANTIKPRFIIYVSDNIDKINSSKLTSNGKELLHSIAVELGFDSLEDAQKRNAK